VCVCVAFQRFEHLFVLFQMLLKTTTTTTTTDARVAKAKGLL